MTSSRGQNVSVIPRSDANSITVFSDTGTNHRSATRKISLRADKTSFKKDKSFGQYSSNTFSINAFPGFRNKECSSNNKFSNEIKSVSSSSLLNSINRELSPVRWCDREVDGVYLGRSGWVQVQQRSLDDCKGALYSQNIDFSTLSSRKNFSEENPDFLKERKECNRPFNLPLSANKGNIRDNCEKSPKFIQGFETVSPPSITPIISPPPAFKDDGLNDEFSRQSIKEPYIYWKSFPQSSEMTADPEIFLSSLLKRRNALNSSSSTTRTESVSTSTLKQQRPSNQPLHTKSFEGIHSHKVWRNRRLDSTARFRGLDNKKSMTNEKKVNISDSFSRNFGNSESVKQKEEVTRNEESTNNRHFIGLQSSSWEALNEQRFLSEAFPRLNYQSNKRPNFTEDYWNSYRTRSSSLDSNNSSSNGSSSSSSNNRRSINYKNFEKAILRKADSKQSQQSKFENSLSRDCRHFNVKRSRSLQLSEKKSSKKSVLLNNSSSENSWNPMLLEHSTFRIKNQNKEQFPESLLNQVFVTVNNESIPVVASSQSLRPLNRITKSEIQQKKLIMEAEKEARIISEFINGTRSRAAARNLLMHRYFNQPEDENSTVLIETKNSQKTEHDPRFLMTNQCPSNKQNCFNKTSFEKESSRKKHELNSLTPDLGQYLVVNYSKPLTFDFSNSSPDFYQSRSFTSFHNYLNQRKVEQVKNKEKEKSYLVHSEQANDNSSKRKRHNTNFLIERTYLNSRTQKERLAFFLTQKQKIDNFERHNTKKLKSEFIDMNSKNKSKSTAQNLSVKTVLDTEKQNSKNNTFEKNSLISSSSSSDICFNDFDTKFKKTKKIMRPSALFKDNVLDANSKTFQERFLLRPGSAPESKSCISKDIYKRSLSLPRSFLSERFRLNNSCQRNLLPLKQGHSETPVEISRECYLNLQGSKTTPTTPVRDLRNGKSMETLYQIPSYRSSCVSLFSETPLFKSRRIIQKSAPKNSEQSAESSDEVNTFCVDKKLLKISDSLSGTILQKLKKNFSLKYLNKKEYLKDSTEGINHKTEGENPETLCATNNLTYKLQASEDDNGNISEEKQGLIRKKSFEKRIFRNGKYDRHGNGIQMINRGIIDSSKFQDTDIQEDADSPLMVNLQKQIKTKKRTNRKVLKRSYSDLGDHRLLDWDIKKYSERLSFYSSPTKSPDEKTIWRSPSSEISIVFNRFERLLKPRLRRSLSQPLGLNDLPPIERRRPSTLKRKGKKTPRQRNSEGEFLSDSESSVSSLCDRKKSFDFAPREETSVLAEAVWDHVVIESDELPFTAGDMIEVLDMRDRDWWWGIAKENSGYFPSAFVRLRVSQEDTVEDCLTAMTLGKNTSKEFRRGKSVSFLSNDQVRSRIIRELLNTERNFVKILHDVKDGYMTQCKQRTDMFSAAQITTIFSNLEDLLVFQNKFLGDLEATIDREFPFKSCIGEVFLNHGSSFRMYSEYCNSHPMAIATLQHLYQKYNYCKFFEMCRLKRNLTEIPLDGYLLTPVQRICKYPLQLGELLKYTKPDHPDYKNVQEALETMRNVATLINERKRKMESLEKLAAWQQKVEGWEGEDLIESSSQLIHQGEVVKMTSGMWSTNITLFLFDHQIIYCKKDLLKKNVYIYKGRISLDKSNVVDLPDGKCQQLGGSIKFGLRINSHLKDKWLIFCCKSEEDKIKWLEVLAEEKKLIAQDKERNLDLPPTAKKLAKMAVRTNKYPPCKLKGKNKFAFNRDILLCTDGHSGVSNSKSNKKIGMWFPFVEMMKNTKVGLKPRASAPKFI